MQTTKQEDEAAMFTAMGLLIDRTLIWSSDFETIRPALCRLFLNSMQEDIINKDALNIAHKIINLNG